MLWYLCDALLQRNLTFPQWAGRKYGDIKDKTSTLEKCIVYLCCCIWFPYIKGSVPHRHGTAGPVGVSQAASCD